MRPPEKLRGLICWALMIALTRLNGKSLVVNAELIRYIESTPDTMITLINGDHLLVRESLENVVELAIEYCRRVRVFKP